MTITSHTGGGIDTEGVHSFCLAFFFWGLSFLVGVIQKSGCEAASAEKWCHQLDAGSVDAKGASSFKSAGTHAEAEKLLNLKAEGKFDQLIRATINGRAGGRTAGGLDAEGIYSFCLSFFF